MVEIEEGVKMEFLLDYDNKVKETNKFKGELIPILLGLFGEVGSLMASAKKKHREGDAFIDFVDNVEEEFGDVLWYFTAGCQIRNLSIEEIFSKAIENPELKTQLAVTSIASAPISRVSFFQESINLDKQLIELGICASAILASEASEEALVKFGKAYLRTLNSANVGLESIVSKNITKINSRFSIPNYENLPTFDEKFALDEQLPQVCKIKIEPRASKKIYMSWNDVYIGNALTDNIKIEDGYRYHDVFHIAYVAILHWSPNFRGLLKRKRKSIPEFDESQDGGRAIAIEEGLTAWIFSRAKNLNYFEGLSTLSFDLLKTIQQHVAGYEVEECPLWLWEKAILDGYKVFREVKKNKGGIVTANRSLRTITYESL
jgi:NTP pyrophosphatase (non-canonical NTP hydrolase)